MTAEKIWFFFSNFGKKNDSTVLVEWVAVYHTTPHVKVCLPHLIRRSVWRIRYINMKCLFFAMWVIYFWKIIYLDQERRTWNGKPERRKYSGNSHKNSKWRTPTRKWNVSSFRNIIFRGVYFHKTDPNRSQGINDFWAPYWIQSYLFHLLDLLFVQLYSRTRTRHRIIDFRKWPIFNPLLLPLHPVE